MKVDLATEEWWDIFVIVEDEKQIRDYRGVSFSEEEIAFIKKAKADFDKSQDLICGRLRELKQW